MKHIRYAVLGALAFEHLVFAADGRSDLSLVIYHPATAEDAEKIRRETEKKDVLF